MKKAKTEPVSRYARMLAALGAESRLRILRLLLSAHPDGMVVSAIQAELRIAGSTLSHHLEKLKNVELVTVRRERQFLWYAVNAGALWALLAFLCKECCSRSQIVKPEAIVRLFR